jgi:hypothetical protein
MKPKIDGSDLIVSSKDVTEPIAVRYAYTVHPVGCNLYNGLAGFAVQHVWVLIIISGRF